MLTGRVIMTSPRGFGFIAQERGANLYFRHHQDVRSGDLVRFDVDEVHGRPRAVNVRAVDPTVAAEVERVFGSASS